MKNFWDDLFLLRSLIKDDIYQKEKSQMTPTDWEAYNACKICESCQSEFNEKVKKCHIHDHHTGSYRAALCYNCNLQKRQVKFIPVVFHNLRGYDGHIIIKRLNKSTNDKLTEVRAIANNSEKYMCFSVSGHDELSFKFIDSFQFISSGLGEIAGGCVDFPTTRHFIKNDEDFKFLSRKGVYPYAWVDSIDKFNATELPPISAFYDDLNKVPCDPKEHEFA